MSNVVPIEGKAEKVDESFPIVLVYISEIRVDGSFKVHQSELKHVGHPSPSVAAVHSARNSARIWLDHRSLSRPIRLASKSEQNGSRAGRCFRGVGR